MTQKPKIRLVRLGEAKRLTKAGDPSGVNEINPLHYSRIG